MLLTIKLAHMYITSPYAKPQPTLPPKHDLDHRPQSWTKMLVVNSAYLLLSGANNTFFFTCLYTSLVMKQILYLNDSLNDCWQYDCGCDPHRQEIIS